MATGTPAYFAFRMRIEQGTVIRAAVRKDGQWHIGGHDLDAAGGGCSVPSVTESHVDRDHLGQIRAGDGARASTCSAFGCDRTTCATESLDRQDRSDRSVAFHAVCADQTFYPDGIMIVCADRDDERRCALRTMPRHSDVLDAIRPGEHARGRSDRRARLSINPVCTPPPPDRCGSAASPACPPDGGPHRNARGPAPISRGIATASWRRARCPWR